MYYQPHSLPPSPPVCLIVIKSFVWNELWLWIGIAQPFAVAAAAPSPPATNHHQPRQLMWAITIRWVNSEASQGVTFGHTFNQAAGWTIKTVDIAF